MTAPSDDGIEIIVPAFIPDDGLGKILDELHRRIARDLAIVNILVFPAEHFEELSQTKAAPARREQED